jgi:hypothetical protein
MIKFFRDIRRNLMEAGKTTKYLKYAIGEIILVVIGILIALQINNWSNKRAARKLEKRYLSELILDLQTDSIVISQAKEKSDFQTLAKNKVLKYYEGKQISEDSLIYFFGEQWRNVSKFHPITTTLDEMKSTGNIGVIQNTTLRRKILETYNYYTTHINNGQERYLLQQHALGELVQSSAPNIFSDLFNESEPLDIISLLNNFEVKNRLLGNAVIGFNGGLKRLQARNSDLLSAIRLESHNID